MNTRELVTANGSFRTAALRELQDGVEDEERWWGWAGDDGHRSYYDYLAERRGVKRLPHFDEDES